MTLSKLKIRQQVLRILAKEKIVTNEVNIYLVNKKEIQRLHHRFFNDDSPTDCISLPMDASDKNKTGYSILGEIFICTDVAKEYALARFADPILETTLYLVHGLLHLIGYDDQDKKDRIKMRKKEKNCIKLIKDLI